MWEVLMPSFEKQVVTLDNKIVNNSTVIIVASCFTLIGLLGND